jgi:hypothetical protein
MFIGHFGVALAAKKFAPRTSLGAAILAAELVDLLWPVFLLLGLEDVVIVPGITRMSPLDFTNYPISHSLLMGLVWAAGMGGAYFALGRYARGAWVVGLLVISHWFLDCLVHRPDLPLYPGSAKFGLGLWNHPWLEASLEIAMFGGGLWVYVRRTRPRDATGSYVFWSLMVLLFAGWIATLLAGPPPSATALAWGGLSMSLLALWAWWADKHREVIGGP